MVPGTLWYHLLELDDTSEIEYKALLVFNIFRKIAPTVFFICLSFCLASPSIAKEDAAIFYSKGMIHFADGEYSQALNFFEKVYQLDPKNQTNLHLLGLTHIKLNDFGQASKYLSKLLKINPDYSEAYLDYGVSLFQQGKWEEALPWFEKVDTKIAAEFIAKIKAGPAPSGAGAGKPAPPEKTKRWALNASSSFYYDSNVTRDPDNQDLTGFAGRKSYMASGTLDFRYLVLDRAKTKLYLDYDGYQSAYFNLHFNVDSDRFNYGRHKGGFDLVYKINDQLQWRLPGYYSFTTLGKAKYLQNIVGENILDWLWKEDWLLSATGGLRRDLFFQTLAAQAQNRDAYQPYLRLEQYFFLPKNRDIYFKAGYEFEKNLATGGDWEFETHQGLYAIHLPLIWKVDCLILGNVVVKRNFKNTDSVFNARRQDSSIYNTVIFSREILRFLKVSTTYSFFIQDSSLDRYTYRRQVAGLTFSTEL